MQAGGRYTRQGSVAREAYPHARPEEPAASEEEEGEEEGHTASSDAKAAAVGTAEEQDGRKQLPPVPRMHRGYTGSNMDAPTDGGSAGDGGEEVPPLYDLFAVTNHYGVMGGGHYVALAKNSTTGQWHSYDDHTVRDVREDQVVTHNAYLLFYVRRDMAESSIAEVYPESLIERAEFRPSEEDIRSLSRMKKDGAGCTIS